MRKKVLIVILSIILCAILGIVLNACEENAAASTTSTESVSSNSSGSKTAKNEQSEETRSTAAMNAKLSEENARHQKALDDLKLEYTTAISKCDTDINTYKIKCTMSEAECNNKIKELDSKIAELQRELNNVHGSGTINQSKRTNLQLSIQSLQSRRQPYVTMLNYYKSIQTLELKKIAIDNEYTDAVIKECDLHERNVESIRNQK